MGLPRARTSIAVAIASAVAAFVFPSLWDRAPLAWSSSTDDASGLSFSYPKGWTSLPFTDGAVRQAVGTRVMNTSLPEPGSPLPSYPHATCSGEWDLRTAPTTFVGVEIAYQDLPIIAKTIPGDTGFPLSFADGERHQCFRDAQVPRHLEAVRIGFTVGGDPGYRVVAWIGAHAARADRRAVERIVASIRVAKR